MHLTEPIGPCMYSIYTSSLKAFTWLQVHSIREAIFHIRSLLWRPTIYPILIDRGCKIRTELFRNCCLFSCSTVVIIGVYRAVKILTADRGMLAARLVEH